MFFELTPANALEFLQRRGWVGQEPARIEPLGWGVSNVVLRVVAAERIFIVKQSRPQLRTSAAWFSDLDRVYREQEVMEALYPLLPPLTVPEVLFSDRANYVFAMSHAPAGSQVWKETLLAGQVCQAIAEQAGRILGRIHEATSRDTRLVERFRDNTVFIQLRVDPFYRCIQERIPEVASGVERIIDKMLSTKIALCHGDYSPKNILTHPQGEPRGVSPRVLETKATFTLVDYETAHFGDPTMDLGFFLSHLILKAVKHNQQRDAFFNLTRAFWQGYTREIQFEPVAGLEAQAIEHFAVCALARIDGTSPVDYLNEEPKRQAVRRMGQLTLKERPARWEEMLQVCEKQCADLK